jgi:hypothetical protein
VNLKGAVRIDIGVSERELNAIVRRGGTVLHTIAQAVAPAADERPDFAAAMAALRAHVDGAVGRTTTGATVRLALLPPLVEARFVALPPLRSAEAAAIIRRDAGRHFFAVAAPRVTTVATPRRASGSPSLAVAASAQLVQELSGAAQQCGWKVGSVAAAQGAWVAAARRAGTDVGTIMAAHGGAVHVLLLADGTPVALRRLPADSLDDIVDAAGGAGAVLLLASGPLREALAQRLAAGGRQVNPLRCTAAEAAALHIDQSRLTLVTDAALQTRQQQQRRLAARLAAAAAVLLVAAAGVELWGAHRQLESARAERAAIRAQVQPLLTLRDSLETLYALGSAVDDMATRAPRWTAVLHDIALMLPEATHMTRFYAIGDTLTIEAEGAGAGVALQSLRGAPSLRDARLVGVVDRELADGETAVERFRITARLAQRRSP